MSSLLYSKFKLRIDNLNAIVVVIKMFVFVLHKNLLKSIFNNYHVLNLTIILSINSYCLF